MNIAVREKSETANFTPSKKTGAKDIFYPESDGKPMGETAFHITLITDLFQILKTFFAERDDAVVIADMMFYYEEGNLRKVIAPDVMIVKGVKNHLRRTFKLWEEKTPDVIFEISSRGTWKEDLQKKYLLYQQIGVKEYYVFDPEYNYIPDEPLMAYHLKDGLFEEVKIKRGRVFSPALNLEIVDTGETLRLYNPEMKKFLPTMQELESEVEKLKAELAKLKRRN